MRAFCEFWSRRRGWGFQDDVGIKIGGGEVEGRPDETSTKGAGGVGRCGGGLDVEFHWCRQVSNDERFAVVDVAKLLVPRVLYPCGFGGFLESCWIIGNSFERRLNVFLGN